MYIYIYIYFGSFIKLFKLDEASEKLKKRKIDKLYIYIYINIYIYITNI